MASQPPPTGHVFISYAREDQAYARKLADSLRQQGFEIWMDDRIDFGDRWWREIVAAMRASAAVVVVMTPDSEGSEWVEREILLAQREKKPTFPLLLRGQENPLLITIQYADVTHGQLPSDNFYARLAQVAPPKPRLEKRPAPPQPQPVEKRVSSSQPQGGAYRPAGYHPAGRHGEPQLARLTSLGRGQPRLEPELIRIPAGEFLMGSDPKKDKDATKHEQPQHRVYLPEYYMARTPVTNAQYLAFVGATGHRMPPQWKAGTPPAGEQDHPAAYVSWRDAMAYCNWLARATNKPYRLPSEAEWEKAARGTDGRIYPWGDEWDARRCGSREDYVIGTRPVGYYSPRGDSPYGCVDMAGNVWEWTSSLWGKNLEKLGFKYPYQPGDGRENLAAADNMYRVQRGSDSGGTQDHARCAYRNRDLPDPKIDWTYRLFNYGFRLCVGPRQ